MEDTQVRFEIYRTLARTGHAPTIDEVASWVGERADAEAALQRLHDDHAIVLDTDGSIRMALPFSAIPTGFTVRTDATSWWANCAWDALAIPVALGVDATIDARWSDTGEPVDLAIRGGEPTSFDGFVHFSYPARRWWDDIVET